MNLIPVGDEVRRVRRRLGLTQEQFAEALRVTPLTIHRWETGQSRPQRAARERLQRFEEHAAALESGRVEEPVSGPADPPALDFAGNPQAAATVAEALRLAHGHQFNPAFAAETARIDPLPHQRIAVYERMLAQDPLRFLLADDAGAGKTIMTGLYLREMLSRGRLARALVVPPAGLVGNWERELRELFRLRFRIVSGADLRDGGAFDGPGSDLAIVSLDTLARESAFEALRAETVRPYDLVVFDEAHKLSARVHAGRVTATRRYRLAEALAGVRSASRKRDFAGLRWRARHLLLLTATPHMGKDAPYHFLWRLLDPHAFSTGEACRRAGAPLRNRHFIRRTKEEMVTLTGEPLYRPRRCNTVSYGLTDGPEGEEALYRLTTDYLRTTYGRALSNRPAAQLAMGVFQRRLASSTWAVLRSFERRIGKLREAAADLESGRTDAKALRAAQRQLDARHREDWFEARTADEDAGPDGVDESHEGYEDAVLGAFVELTVEGLQQEIATLEDLRDRARRLLDAGAESKFDRLREVLEAPDEEDDEPGGGKWLLFTEHRDTADYLVRRLEGLGFVGGVALIHGGLAWREREEQVAHFRDPQGARYLVATDAAGEGINLQFCSRMANYDIPWNPARLEQRMGRIHRYGQRREVRIANLVAGDTYEGRVLEVLLEKLDAIRDELSSDKVFDVIGRLFEGRPLGEVMLGGLAGDRDPEAAERLLAGRLTADRVAEVSAEQQRIYGQPGEVAERLPELRADLDRERYLELLPAYVRRFVEQAAPLLHLEVRGDPDRFFTLASARPGALDPLLPALETHPPAARSRLTVRRPPAEPGEPGVWLHPGETVFDTLTDEVGRRHRRDARRGAIFVDARAKEPYFFHLALVAVKRRPAPVEDEEHPGLFTARPDDESEVVERRLLGIRQAAGAAPTAEPVERLMLLRPAPEIAPGGVPLAARGVAMRAEAAALAERVRDDLVEERRTEARRELPERRRRLAVGFDLKAAELAARRSKLASGGQGAAEEEEREEVRTEQRRLARDKRRALADLEAGPSRIVPGGAPLLLHALVVPSDDEEEKQQYDATVEEIAVRHAVEWERRRGWEVSDVSKPALAQAQGLPDWPGFDLLSRGPAGEEICIEVKGRAGRGGINLQVNEWKQALHRGEAYWIYAVFDCGTPKQTLKRLRNPARVLAASRYDSSVFAIPFSELVEKAERD